MAAFRPAVIINVKGVINAIVTKQLSSCCYFDKAFTSVVQQQVLD